MSVKAHLLLNCAKWGRVVLSSVLKRMQRRSFSPSKSWGLSLKSFLKNARQSAICNVCNLWSSLLTSLNCHWSMVSSLDTWPCFASSSRPKILEQEATSASPLKIVYQGQQWCSHSYKTRQDICGGMLEAFLRKLSQIEHQIDHSCHFPEMQTLTHEEAILQGDTFRMAVRRLSGRFSLWLGQTSLWKSWWMADLIEDWRRYEVWRSYFASQNHFPMLMACQAPRNMPLQPVVEETIRLWE